MRNYIFRFRRRLPEPLRNFHTWLMALPWQFFVLALAGLALNAASDLGNTFGAAPRFGGPWVAWGTLLAFLGFFALALLAVSPIDIIAQMLKRVVQIAARLLRVANLRGGSPPRSKNKALRAAGEQGWRRASKRATQEVMGGQHARATEKTQPAQVGFVASAFRRANCFHSYRLRSSAWTRRFASWLLRYLLTVFVMWTALQSLVVFAHMPRTLASPKSYGSDEMYYAHYNAWLVLHGRNPYVGDQLAGALLYFHVDNVTLLRGGRYSDPLLPPTNAQTQTIVAAYLANPHAPHPQLEPATTHSYPALSFLIALPSVWAGLPTLSYLQVIGLLGLLITLIMLAPRRWRIAIAALCLLDVDGIRSVAGSDFAIWTVAGMALVWIWGSEGGMGRVVGAEGNMSTVGTKGAEGTVVRWGNTGAINRAPTQIFGDILRLRSFLAAIALGLVCAVQQTAWFFAPFYLLWVWRARGWRAVVREGAVAAGAFMLVNLPWIVASPGPWLHSLWLPMTLPLFPTGGGLVGLGLGGALPLWPSGVYTALELLAFGGLLAAYARWGAKLPFAGMLLPLLPIMFAWRSPSRYFILLPLLAVLAVVLQWRATPPDPAPAHRPVAE